MATLQLRQTALDYSASCISSFGSSGKAARGKPAVDSLSGA
jgi:hypothetical protein